jgi:hypothetical protein
MKPAHRPLRKIGRIKVRSGACAVGQLARELGGKRLVNERLAVSGDRGERPSRVRERDLGRAQRAAGRHADGAAAVCDLAIAVEEIEARERDVLSTGRQNRQRQAARLLG